MRTPRLGQHPDPTHVVAHLSDIHLLDGGLRQYGVIHPEAGLECALERLARIDPPPQALVFTGDLADRAEPASYQRLRELVEPFADSIGAQVVWCMGNHDERAEFAAGLYGAASDDAPGPQDRVFDVDGLRIVALDTTVPGFHHGALEPSQLDWLADVLATPAAHGTLLAMHHPPIPLPLLPAAELIELDDQHLLEPVIRGTDVRGIIAGHLHLAMHSTFAGVPVSVASATCYAIDPAPVDRYVSGVDGDQAFVMLHCYADRVVHTPVSLTSSAEVSGMGPEALELLAAVTPAQARDEVSRKDSDFNTRNENHS